MAIDSRTSLVAHGKRSGLICVSMHLHSAHERKLTGLGRGEIAASELAGPQHAPSRIERLTMSANGSLADG